ncbi:MAG: hypothetical protein OHK0046_46680 [Anaerolineae bacterium]
MWYAFPLILAMALYGYSVTLPFFLDDGPHIQLLSQTDGLRHWGDFPGFPFYRPVAFTLWKILGYDAPQDAALLHLVNVLCFGLAGVVVGQIVRRAAPAYRRGVNTPRTPVVRRTRVVRALAAVVAGSFFVVFPFSYQAVAMIAALFHLTLTLGIVVCLWAALHYVDAPRPAWFALVMVSAFLAVFSHENGVLLPVLLLGLLLIYRAPRRRLLMLLLPVSGVVAVYVLLWGLFRPQDSTGLTHDFQVSFAMLLQGLVFPFVAQARHFFPPGDADAGVLLALIVFFVGGVLAIVWQTRWRWLGAYGAGWFVVSVLPAAVLLPAGYVLGQPRLALLASVGGGVLFGALIATLADETSLNAGMDARYAAIIVLAVIAVTGVLSLEYLRERRAEFLRLRDYNQAVLALLGAHNVIERGAVLVNAPDYLTPDEANRRFLLGTEGVLYVDETLDYNQQFWMNSDTDYQNIEVIAYPEIQRSAGFGFRAHPPALDRAGVIDVVRDAPYVIVTHFDGLDFYPVLVGGAAVAGDDVPDVRYDGGFLLTDAHFTYDETSGEMDVQVRWRVDNPENIKTFIHVYCDDTFIAQSDGYPWGDTYPFAAWSTGETQTDIRQILLEAPVPAGCLRVYAGLYREADVSRLEAVNAATGERYENDLFPIMRDRES